MATSSDEHAPPADGPADTERVPPRRRAGLWLDIAIIALLFTTGALVCVRYVNTWGGGQFVEKSWWYAPSAMYASGAGLVWPKNGAVPGLDDFLGHKTDSFACADVSGPIETQQLNVWHKCHRYLLLAVGTAWSVSGVSWRALAWLTGILCGLTIALSYGLFRLAANRLFSAAGALLFLFFPSHLSNLPHLRDYAKAPFILAVILLLGFLIRRERSTRTLLAAAAALGLICGIGIGFRLDISICVPACAVVYLCFLPGPLLRRIPLKAACIVLLTALYLTASFPIRNAIKNEESTAPHNILGGVAYGFESVLGIGGVPYSFMPLFLDSYICATSVSYAERVVKAEKPVVYHMPEYTEAGRACLKEYLKTFPADMLVRAYAAVLRVVETTPMEMNESAAKKADPFIVKTKSLSLPLAAHLEGAGRYYVAAFLLLLSAFWFRRACAVLFLLMYFCGVTALQFQARHHFHLGFVSLWSPFALASLACYGLWHLRRAEHRTAFIRALRTGSAWKSRIARALGFASLAAAGVLIPLVAIRAYQSAVVGELFQRYAKTPLEEVAFESVADAPAAGWTLLKPTSLFDPANYTDREKQWAMKSEYLTLALWEGPATAASVWISYKCAHAASDFSHLFSNAEVPLGEAYTRVFFPVYNSLGGHDFSKREFQGIAVRTESMGRVKGLFRVPGKDTFRLMPMLALAGDGQDAGRYLRFADHKTPYYIRAYRSTRPNLLPNGGFEDWPDGTPSPRMFQEPAQQSSAMIERETELVAEGRVAVRETWTAAAPTESIWRKFSSEPVMLTPGEVYEVFLKARNASDGVARVAAWQVSREVNGERAERQLALICVERHDGFREYSTKFLVPPDTDGDVVFVTSFTGKTYPATAVWDDWRLGPALP